MSILNFFRRKNNPADHETPIDESSAGAGKYVDPSLFVDEQEPIIEDRTKKQINHIEAFLGQNFEWQGYNDGYGYPNTEYLENKLKLIKADFRFTVDKCLDAKRSELGDLKLHVIKTAGISSRLEDQLKEKIKMLEINIHELDMQKILSIENEGIVASAVHAYRLGFIKGVEKFQQEKLFAGTTGLYN